MLELDWWPFNINQQLHTHTHTHKEHKCSFLTYPLFLWVDKLKYQHKAWHQSPCPNWPPDLSLGWSDDRVSLHTVAKLGCRQRPVQGPDPRNPRTARSEGGVSSFAIVVTMIGFILKWRIPATSWFFDLYCCQGNIMLLQIKHPECNQPEKLCFSDLSRPGKMKTPLLLPDFSIFFFSMLLQNLPADKMTAMRLPPKSTSGARVNEKVCMLILYLSAQTSYMWLFLPAPSAPFWFTFIHQITSFHFHLFPVPPSLQSSRAVRLFQCK